MPGAVCGTRPHGRMGSRPTRVGSLPGSAARTVLPVAGTAGRPRLAPRPGPPAQDHLGADHPSALEAVLPRHARHTVRPTARLIVEIHAAHYRMTVKANAARTSAALAGLDGDQWSTGCHADPEEKAPGRIERRRSRTLSSPPGTVNQPHLRQIVRIQRERHSVRTGPASRDSAYDSTSVPAPRRARHGCGPGIAALGRWSIRSTARAMCTATRMPASRGRGTLRSTTRSAAVWRSRSGCKAVVAWRRESGTSTCIARTRPRPCSVRAERPTRKRGRSEGARLLPASAAARYGSVTGDRIWRSPVTPASALVERDFRAHLERRAWL